MNEEIKHFPDATTRPMLLSQIQDALKNRQHVEIVGEMITQRNLLSELITFERGKAIIPARHEEDFSFQIIENIAFPTSDKMTIENLMRQVLQTFGWPPISNLGFVQFCFGKLLKELTYDRVIPVILIEHPDVMRDKAYRMLQIISEYTIDRKPVGIPTIMCNPDKLEELTPIGHSGFVVRLRGGITSEEVIGLIEEVAPGKSSCFDSTGIEWLHELSSPERMKAKAKELLAYMQTLGLTTIGIEMIREWIDDFHSKRNHAKKHA